MAFKIYVDDSGTGRNGPVFLLAACEATAASWAAFSNDWKGEIDAEPRIEYFKASECFALRGQFEAIERAERDRRVLRLAQIIRKYVERVYLFKVNYDDFDGVFFHQIDGRYDEPYFFMAHDLCEQIFAIYIASKGEESVEIIFYKRDGTEQLIKDLYKSYKESVKGTERERHFREVMPSLPSFEDEKDSVPLQAADMLAWFFRRIFSDEILSHGAGAAWDAVKEIDWHLFDADKDFLAERRDCILRALPPGKVYFHQLEKSRKDFDQKITDHNIQAIKGQPDYPILNSISSKQMRQRLLVRNCTVHDMPHLHTKDGTRCLLESD